MAQRLELRTKYEVEALHEVIEEVDFYALLQIPRNANAQQVAEAFAIESRKYHPDRFFGIRDAHFVRKLTAIYRKISEANSVLRDTALRSRYDQRLGIVDVTDGYNTSLQTLEFEVKEEQKARRLVCTTRQGRRYYELAMTAQRNADLSGMVMNLQFALSFERDNEALNKLLATSKDQLSEEKAKQPYKVKVY